MTRSGGSGQAKPTAVIDTQVWVSGLLNPMGAAAKVVRAFEAGLFELAISEAVFDEYERVLHSFEAEVGADLIDEVMAALLEAATVVVPTELPLLCRDPSDNKFVECALAASAAWLVTKNTKHYPTEVASTRVVHISEFLRALGL